MLILFNDTAKAFQVMAYEIESHKILIANVGDATHSSWISFLPTPSPFILPKQSL